MEKRITPTANCTSVEVFDEWGPNKGQMCMAGIPEDKPLPVIAEISPEELKVKQLTQEEVRQNTIRNPVVLDGEPQIAVLRRPDIKLATHPEITVALPVGDKEVGQVFVCPKEHGGCGLQWYQHGFRHPHLVPVAFMIGHMNLVPPLNVTMAYLFEGGRLSAEARQIMTKKAIRMGSKYILYWDDDTIPHHDSLFKLHTWMEMHPDAGAVTGIYTTRTNPPVPLIFEKHGVGPAWGVPLGEDAEPQPVFGSGAGFLLARVEAIKDVIEKEKAANNGQEIAMWQDTSTQPADKYDPEKPMRDQFHVTWGHDIRFCKLLNEHDWPVYAHGQVLCGHYDIETGKTFKVPDDAPGFKHAE
jgi:hypothetical protein